MRNLNKQIFSHQPGCTGAEEEILHLAREILTRLIGESMDWVPLDAYLDQYLSNPEQRKTATASSFASSLELARQGQIELRQTLTFGPLFMRRKVDGKKPE